MKCLHCKVEMKGKTSAHIDRSGSRVTVDSVPAWVCTQCGESTFKVAEVDAIQDLTQIPQQKSAEMIRKSQVVDWRLENRSALEEYNRRTELSGVFSEGLRRF